MYANALHMYRRFNQYLFTCCHLAFLLFYDTVLVPYRTVHHVNTVRYGTVLHFIVYINDILLALHGIYVTVLEACLT